MTSVTEMAMMCLLENVICLALSELFNQYAAAMLVLQVSSSSGNVSLLWKGDIAFMSAPSKLRTLKIHLHSHRWSVLRPML